jgi:phosphoserine phosphatase RsbU/P
VCAVPSGTAGSVARPRLELADIVRTYGDGDRQTHRLTTVQHRALRAIAACRTALLIELGDGRLAFVVADVAGKGLPAALLMTLLRGSLRSLLSAGLRGTALVTALNTHLVANTPGNRMITCFYGELDPVTGRLIYVNAGHNPPYLYGGDGPRTLDSTAVVLGMIDGMPFPEASADLRAGSRLLLYTDGITEAENRTGEQFGVERLEAAIAGPGRSEPAGALDAIIATVVRFRGTARQSDDMTMMLVSREGAA